MFVLAGKRFNILCQHAISGVTYPAGAFASAELRAAHGVVELPDPTPLDERFYYNQELDEAPYMVSTPKSLSQCKEVKLSELAAKRFDIETGGVTVNGVPTPTDRNSRTELYRVVGDINNGFLTTVNWKSPSGFVQLDKATIMGMAQAVSTHVQAAFNNEAAHTAAIQALNTVEEVIAYDFGAGW